MSDGNTQAAFAFVQSTIHASIETKARLLAECSQDIAAIGERLVEIVRHGGKIMLCGNGGSAADAQHLAAEMVGRLRHDRRPVPALALTTDTSILTAVGNDYDFTAVFSRQLRALGRPGDALVAISTSGNSKNILEAVRVAKEMKILTIGLLGRGGGLVASECDRAVVVPGDDTQRAQECHILVGHIWMEMIERQVLGE